MCATYCSMMVVLPLLSSPTTNILTFSLLLNRLSSLDRKPIASHTRPPPADAIAVSAHAHARGCEAKGAGPNPRPNNLSPWSSYDGSRLALCPAVSVWSVMHGSTFPASNPNTSLGQIHLAFFTMLRLDR